MHVDKIASEERGITQNNWLDSRHTYSFGPYHNLKRINFGTLRVFNDDVIKPSMGFGTHSHDNMEIITIVLEGQIEHKDSTGNHGVIKANEVQRMTAGSGIQHSEFNPSKNEQVHLLQIWVYPEKRDLEPGYEQKSFNPADFKNKLFPVVSHTQSDQAIFIHQDASFFLGALDAGKSVTHTPKSKKHGDYLFVIEGEVAVEDKILKTGDSAQITEVGTLEIRAVERSKVLLIEVSVSTL